MKIKSIFAIDVILIVGSIFVLIMLVGYSRPLVIAPLSDYETNQTSVLFSIEKAEKLLIDDNIDFTSPEEFLIMYAKTYYKHQQLTQELYDKKILEFMQRLQSYKNSGGKITNIPTVDMLDEESRNYLLESYEPNITPQNLNNILQTLSSDVQDEVIYKMKITNRPIDDYGRAFAPNIHEAKIAYNSWLAYKPNTDNEEKILKNYYINNYEDLLNINE